MECYIHQGEHVPAETTEVHHVHPQAYGGTDDPDNKVVLCVGCHTIVHRAALKLYAGNTGPARDVVERYIPNQPARQERLWRLVQAVTRARSEHAKTTEIPEAGVDTADQATVKMSLAVPDWLHHRLKALAGKEGLYRYVMKILENHALVATQKPGASAKELFGVATPTKQVVPTMTLLDPHGTGTV